MDLRKAMQPAGSHQCHGHPLRAPVPEAMAEAEDESPDWLRALKRRRFDFVPATGDGPEDEAQEVRLPPEPEPAIDSAPVSVAGSTTRVLTTVPDGAVDSESSAQGDELVLLSWLASERPWSSSFADSAPAAHAAPAPARRIRILQVKGDGLAAIGIASLLGGSHVETVVLAAAHVTGIRASQQPLCVHRIAAPPGRRSDEHAAQLLLDS
jgi:hypothetical protein